MNECSSAGCSAGHVARATCASTCSALPLTEGGSVPRSMDWRSSLSSARSAGELSATVASRSEASHAERANQRIASSAAAPPPAAACCSTGR